MMEIMSRRASNLWGRARGFLEKDNALVPGRLLSERRGASCVTGAGLRAPKTAAERLI
jgi:hypothetical protein